MIFLKREETFLIALFGILFFIVSSVSAEIITGLEIPNAPPILLKDIPNQSWLENQSKINAFDLDDYFADPEGENLSYYNSSIDSIYVFIDPLTNEVSFFPDSGFHGMRNVTFYASDSIYDTLSNVVVLSVGLADYPPQWYSPAIDKTTIYQNDVVSFSTLWTDDRALDRYIFSINQGSGWENLTSVNFSGIENTSLANVQIKAPGLSTVYWRFYGFDSSGNVNVTDIQSFLVSSQQIPPQGGAGEGANENGQANEGLINKLLTKIQIQQRKGESFQVTPSEFKISLKQGTFKTKILKITNTGLENVSIQISSQKVSDFTIFSETEVSIMPGKSKDITIDFNAPDRAIPGEYFGYITLTSDKLNRSLPVILDINAKDIGFNLILNLSEGYEIVKPGKNVKANITLINTKDLRQIDASVYYAIKDYEGTIYNFSEQNVTFLSALTFGIELKVPEISPEGKYILYARAADEKNIAIDSVEFEVGTRFNFSSFIKLTSLLILIIIFAILLAAFMVKYKRDQKRERLLELYIMLNKLKNLIKKDKEEEALKLFIKIKESYNEPVPKEIFDDKERLKKEISDLYESFTKDSKEIVKTKDVQENKKELKDSLPKEKGEK